MEKRRPGRPKKEHKKTSRVVRLSSAVYERLNLLKGEKSYSEFLEDFLLTDAVYALDEDLLTDLSVARGNAILSSARTGKPAKMPLILIPVGRDVV